MAGETATNEETKTSHTSKTDIIGFTNLLVIVFKHRIRSIKILEKPPTGK